MAEFYTTKNEMAVRAQLMVGVFAENFEKIGKNRFFRLKTENFQIFQVRASDELLRLTTDLKEFLILHDFHFLTHNIKS